jgi:Tol biopolymer transport system component
MNKKVLIGILVVVGISAIGLTYFLLRANQPKEYLLTVSNGAIYRISADGKEIKELGEGMDGEVQVYSFSPDGKKILFSYRPFSKFRATSLWIMDSDGSNREKLIDAIDDGFEDAYFSKDGQKILFRTVINKNIESSETSLTIYSLWIMNLDGSNRKKLIDGTNGSVESVAFSPDGRKILLLINDTAPTKTLQKIQDLDSYSFLIMDAYGNNKKNLGVTVKGYIWDISFSPDGEEILFIAVNSEGKSLCIMDLYGNNKKKIAGGANTEVYEARFSPDGSKIYFVTEENKPEPGYSSWYLWVENIDGTDKKNITEDINKNSIYFSISPDGSKIAFVVASSSDEYSLWIMNSDGTDKKNLMGETRGIWISDSSFSPTGKKILLHDSSLWVVNLNGSKKVRLYYVVSSKIGIDNKNENYFCN